MTYIDVMTFGIALVGAVLGILNLIIERGRTRVRLKVIPKLCYQMGPDLWLASIKPDSKTQAKIDAPSRPFRWAIEVINLSEFPVSISQIGFGNSKGDDLDGARATIVAPDIAGGRKMPVRLESRQAETFYSTIGQSLSRRAVASPTAWVITDCGETRTGSSPVIVAEAAKLARTA